MSTFRIPWTALNKSPMDITYDRCMQGYEDLQDDLRRLSDEDIVKKLDDLECVFFAKEEYVYPTDTIYDYVFVFSGYEVVYIETNDCCEFKHGCYAYSDDGHWWNYGFDEVTCYITDKICERLFNIGMEWLTKQPFKTYAEYLKFRNTNR